MSGIAVLPRETRAEERRSGPFRVDPARVVEVLAEARRGMGDGRAEVDDPLEHGVAAVPRSLPIPPPSSNAEIVRRFVREWKLRTGRIKPEAAPRGRRVSILPAHRGEGFSGPRPDRRRDPAMVVRRNGSVLGHAEYR